MEDEVSKATKVPTASVKEIGATGLNIVGGLVSPNEPIPDLQGSTAIKTYTKMKDNEPIVGAVLFALKMLMRQTKWHMEPFSEDPDHLEKADYVDTCRNDMSHTWSDFISEVCTMFPYGWEVNEIVYKTRNGFVETESEDNSKYSDGLTGWKKLPTRSQESHMRWNVKEGTDKIVSWTQRPAPLYRERTIPMEKLLLFRTESSQDSPEGRSILRNAYRPWYFKQRIEEIEGVGIERDLAGLPIASVDPELLSKNASDDQKAMLAAITDIVKNVRRDAQEGIVWPSQFDENGNQLYKFELLSAGGTRQFDTSGIIERYVQHIAMCVLADFILLGHESTGSFALSSDKTNLFAVALGGWLDSVADVFNRCAIPRLFELNGWDTEELPKLVHDDIEAPDLAQLSAFIGALVAAGMPLFPDERLEQWVRQAAGMPKPDPNANPTLPPTLDPSQAGPTDTPGSDSVAPGTSSDQPGQVPRTPEQNRPPDTTKSTLGKSDHTDGLVFVDVIKAWSEAARRARWAGHQKKKDAIVARKRKRSVAGKDERAKNLVRVDGKADGRNKVRVIGTDIVNPLTGEKMDNGQMGRVFEKIFERKVGNQVSKFVGVPGAKIQVVSSKDGGSTTTAIDLLFSRTKKLQHGKHVKAEMKTLNALTPAPKSTMHKDQKIRKMKDSMETGAVLGTIVQNYNPKTGVVGVHIEMAPGLCTPYFLRKYKSTSEPMPVPGLWGGRVKNRKPEFEYTVTNDDIIQGLNDLGQGE